MLETTIEEIKRGVINICKYCEEENPLSYDLDGYESRIYCNKGNLRYSCDNGEYDFRLKINYCPMCCKRLGDE